jgi:TonB family protein
MIRIVYTAILMCFAAALFAQQDTITITKDTINLRGVIYLPDGKPAKNMGITSRQLDFRYNEFPLYAKTDTNGYFVINGAKPNDTLSFYDGNYQGVSFPNKGSRYMVIYLPLAKVIQINGANPIEVKAVNKYPKVKPSFRVTSSNILDGGCTIVAYPQFPGGIEKFINYNNQRLIYPDKAITHNIEGTVEIGFTIERDGSLTDIKIIKGIGYGCDEQIVAILKKSPKWSPGIFCGRPYSIQETISVKFSLTDN